MGCKQRCECDNVLYERLVVLKIMKRKTPFHSIERRHAVHRQHLHVLCLSSLLSLWWVWCEIWLSPSAVDTWQNDSPFARTSGTITFQMPEGSGIKVTNAQWMATAMGIVIYVGTHCYHSILHGSLNHFGIVYTYVLQALTANNAFILLVITHFFMIFFLFACAHVLFDIPNQTIYTVRAHSTCNQHFIICLRFSCYIPQCRRSARRRSWLRLGQSFNSIMVRSGRIHFRVQLLFFISSRRQEKSSFPFICIVANRMNSALFI